MKPSFGKILLAVLVFGLCLGAAFGAGTVYGRHSKTSGAAAAAGTTFNSGNSGSANRSATDTATSAAVTSSGTPAGGTANGAPGFFGGFGARPIEATVAAVSDTQLQVNLQVGGNASATPTSIALDSQTTYATAKKAEKSAITTGAHVYVSTSAAADGTLTASTVIVLPATTQTTTGQSTTGASGTGQGTGGFGSTGGQGTGGFRGGAGGANRPVDGTVASLNGQQLQVTLANGSTSTVTLSDQTIYESTSTADKSAVTTGASVLVTTSRGSDGGLSAASVIVLPSSGQTN